MNTVHLIDCMEFMADIPDKYYELAIVDPPYGIGQDGQKECICKNPKHNRKEHLKKQWDNNIPDAKYFTELFRISQNQIVWGANYFVKYLTEGHKGWGFWYKGQEGLTMSDGEIFYSSFDVATRIVIINRVELLKQGTIHPTEKPIMLYKWLLQNYAKPHDKIFDSHVGSGSSRIACYDLGFDFEGCELAADYHKAQEERYQSHIKQQSLFDTAEIQSLIYKDNR
jgi:site-specific DNA-methyltransferase (adenine-specific)